MKPTVNGPARPTLYIHLKTKTTEVLQKFRDLKIICPENAALWFTSMRRLATQSRCDGQSHTYNPIFLVVDYFVTRMLYFYCSPWIVTTKDKITDNLSVRIFSHCAAFWRICYSNWTNEYLNVVWIHVPRNKYGPRGSKFMSFTWKVFCVSCRRLFWQRGDVCEGDHQVELQWSDGQDRNNRGGWSTR